MLNLKMQKFRFVAGASGFPLLAVAWLATACSAGVGESSNSIGAELAVMDEGRNASEQRVRNESARRTPPLAIQGVTVLTMEPGSSPTPDMTVIIADQRVISIAASGRTTVPPNAVRIDGRGRWLLPALVDAHVHIPNPRMLRLILDDPSIQEGGIEDADLLLPYVAHGVLQVGNLAAMSEAIGQRRAVESGTVLGPHMMLAAMIDGDAPLFPIGLTRTAANPEDGRQAVRDVLAEGYDMVKAYNSLTLETFTAILEEARQHDLKVVGHIPRSGPVDSYFQAGFTIAHADELASRVNEFSDAEVARMVALAREHTTALMSTLTPNQRTLEQALDPDTLHTRPEIRFVHPLVRRYWDERNPFVGRGDDADWIDERRQSIAFNDRLVRAFVNAGLPVLAGTDSLVPGVVAGTALHDELTALVAAGLTPYQALDAATRVPMVWMGVADDRGTVAVGKRADLLLLDADPLADIANTRQIAGVIASGRWLSREKLDARLAALVARFDASTQQTD